MPFDSVELKNCSAFTANLCMRLVYFLCGLAGGIFTLFRVPHLPLVVNDALTGGDHEKFVALSFVCVTVLTAILTVVCVKKTFPPLRTK